MPHQNSSSAVRGSLRTECELPKILSDVQPEYHPKYQGRVLLYAWHPLGKPGGILFGSFPSMVGRNKTTIFAYVKDRIQSRLHSWNKKFLSRAGKEVLLKTVAQVIPIYVMSVFLLPKSMCLEIEKLMNAYWWGNVLGKKGGLCWSFWENLSIDKKLGGMRFRK